MIATGGSGQHLNTTNLTAGRFSFAAPASLTSVPSLPEHRPAAAVHAAAPSGSFNDDTGPFSYGEFRFTPAAPGTHYVGVQRYGTSVGNYLLVVDKL